MAERSRDRSSSTESQPKFPECSHFRRRNDNHRRCQQCRLNDGLLLCTQDSPCLVCQDWLPEAWTAQAKAIAQRNRRKAAAAAKAARKETEMLDDSVELHAPRDAFPTKRTKSKDSSKAKRSKTVTNSSQPKSVASSVKAVERPSSHGSDHRRSRTPERKRRHGEERRHESPRHQSSRRDGSSSDRRESERARPSSSGGSSSRRRAVSSSVSKASDTRPSSSSSRHHQHLSSGDRRSLSSSSSRGPQTASLSPVTARDDKRAPTGRVGRLSPDGMSSYPLRNALSRWFPRRLDRFILNRPQQFQSRPQQFQSRPRQRTAQQVRARQQAAARPRVTSRQRATARSQATTRPQVTARPQATARPQGTARLQATAQPQGMARQQGTARPQVTTLSQWTARPQLWIQTLTTQQMSRWWSHHIVLSYVLMTQTIWMVQHLFQQREWAESAGQENPAATPVGGPDSSILTGTSTPPLFLSIPKTISQSTLVDFMSLWTLPQRRLELPSVSDNSISPAVQSSLPVPEHDSDNKRSATRAGSLSSDGPRRPTDRPGLPWDRPERPWEDLVTTASPGIQDRAPHSPDPHQWSPQHETGLHSTSMLRWTWIPKKHFRRMRMLRATARRSLQRNMKSSGKLSLHPRERSRSTLPRLNEQPGPLC